MPAIVFYVSGHGFGHAARQIEVIHALVARQPDLEIIVRTSASRWLFGLTLRHPVELQEAEVDTGVVQIDSLRLDELETIRRAWHFHCHLDDRAEREARLLQRSAARVVVSDIPPLAFAAAARVGVPAVAVANFTWDWIYDGYPEAAAHAPDLIETIGRAYQTAAFACRLPLWGGFNTFRRVVDVPFIARRSQRDPRETRRALELPLDRRLVLVSFGGYAPPAFEWSALEALSGYGVVTIEGGTAMSRPVVQRGALFRLNERAMYQAGVRYEDLVGAVDVAVTKPGYGIVSECIANQTAMLYTSRGRFVEYDVLASGMPRFLRCAYIDRDQLAAGHWTEHLDRLLAQPSPPERPRTDGAPVVADLLLEQFR